ncbi:MAG: D-alanyl-D-alanine carboxypeptidase family protein [Pigmentiphaga sp.]|uniref:D-alanyl-D-alanine carboxypeptidase family protein n=1 Tax=Pigmentiphaga sp. TaxID=1977564 RepID=UPI0029B1F948|nr:D-alanyl-D-alanine carboxypeptidase family protein [Pigmentiphaga sp.]MDX3906860.1 D-alanyl-D-alanine carboxypeptidase family protein [Pigmentiphaga sp.]
MKLRFFSFGPGRRVALATMASACLVAFPAAMPASALAAAAPPATTSSAAPSAPPMSTVGLLSSVPAPAIAARSWVTIDVTSDQILAEDRADERVEPASLTKVMSAYLVFNALKEKRLTLSQTVNVSEKAWRTGGSRMFIEPRKPVTVEELIRGMITQSGNDATVALAEAVAGSEDAFVALMNQEAARLGLKNTHFTNSTGLPDPQHVTTVRDLALLAKRLIQDHPDYYGYYKEREFTYNKITQPNRNRLLWVDPSVDGMKTGHTEAAGYCLIASAMRGDRRILTVLVGTASENARAQESLKLLNWSFQNFDTVRVYDAKQAVVEPTVWKGSASKVKLGSPAAIWVTVPRGQAGNVKSTIERTDPLVAPLQAGQPVGTLKLTLNDKPIREVPLTVLESVEVAGIFGRAFDAVRLWFQ